MNLGTKAAVPRFISPSLTRTRAGRHHMQGLTAGVADPGFFGLRVRVGPPNRCWLFDTRPPAP
jgi:hypothetical protein